MVIDSMRAITVDEMHGFVYWSDIGDDKVRRATLKGSNQRVIYNVISKYNCMMDQLVWFVLL